MDDAARASLTNVGWDETRRYPTDDVARRLQQRGFTLFPAARAFLECYGGLFVHTAPRESDTEYFHTCPDEVATDPGWTAKWERVSGTRVFPIGKTAFGDYTLIMDEHGRVFGMDMYLQMTYWADDTEELLDAILGNGGTFRPVYPEDRRPIEPER
ncbi:MAG: SUKH-3 domain-containing protein [Burkholderiaceae bacterium]|nr:SUKH-3 domain-containing protein [Burkholderiaceae bacterium]MBP8310024.1 SUKH-3 domain-containing protein [Burkholderiaceae bacterium]